MNKNLLIGIGILLAVIVAGFYFLKSPKVTYPTSNVGSGASTAPKGPIKEFSVSATEFAYTPSTITVIKGDSVKINFTNNGTATHNLAITNFNVATNSIAPGESDSIIFTADKSGSFSYFCSIGGHRSLGMEGTLTVQ